MADYENFNVKEFSRHHAVPNIVKNTIETDNNLKKFPQQIQEEAIDIFHRLYTSGMKCKVRTQCIMFCVYSAYKNLQEYGYSIDPKIMANMFNMSMKDFNKAREKFSETKTGIHIPIK